MKNTNIKIQSFILGAVTSVVFVAFATIFGELHHPFKDWLAMTFSHHWVGKGIISVAIFLFFGFLGHFWLDNNTQESTLWWLRTLAWILILSFFAILLFYLYEWFNH